MIFVYESNERKAMLSLALILLLVAHSYVEESNADKAIKALTAALAPKARVKRDGKVSSVDASGLVPGDIIVIQFGNIVPADIKLLGEQGEEDQPLQVGPGFKPRPKSLVADLAFFYLFWGFHHGDKFLFDRPAVCRGIEADNNRDRKRGRPDSAVLKI
jgi:hypothetical protein